MKYITKQGEYIDEICWEKFGVVSGVFEQVLELNPGLSSMPLSLPEGVEIILPDEISDEVTEITRLFS